MKNEEIEYKFTISEDTIPFIAHHAILGHYAKQPCEEQNLYNIYFDTLNLDLKNKGYMLRVRRLNGYFQQTLKKNLLNKNLGKGLHRRAEWNWMLLDSEINIDLLPDDVKKELALFLPQLQPIFESEFKRKTWQLYAEDQTHIEFAIDQGVLTVEDQTLPICEIELELKMGQLKVLDQIVLQLQKDVDLLPESQTKAERGYILYQNYLKSRNA